jgi:20S proteasome alpha/beta subunit
MFEKKHPQLVQLEHSAKAVPKYSIGVAVCCRDGVILAKAMSNSFNQGPTRLVDTDTSRMNSPVLFDNGRLGAIVVGLPSDARLLLDRILSIAADYSNLCQESIGCMSLTARVASQLYETTLTENQRGLAVHIILAGPSSVVSIDCCGGTYSDVVWCRTAIEGLEDSDDACIAFQESMNRVNWLDIGHQDAIELLNRILSESDSLKSRYLDFNIKFISSSN